ncbi:MAG: hypothetical protein AB7S51_11890 [Porticoccaceae bacterium]
MSFIVSAEPTTYTLKNDAKTQVIAAFDCTPGFSGKAALGNDKYAYVWECESNTESKYSIYKTSYMSHLSFTFSSKDDAADFFTKYLAGKASSYSQNSRMSNLKYVILYTNYSSKESAYSDYFITYQWDNQLRMAQQGRFLFRNGYVADWSVTSPIESGVAADEFNGYVKYFQIKTL